MNQAKRRSRSLRAVRSRRWPDFRRWHWPAPVENQRATQPAIVGITQVRTVRSYSCQSSHPVCRRSPVAKGRPRAGRADPRRTQRRYVLLGRGHQPLARQVRIGDTGSV